jgi:hypothetical protein
VDVYGWGSGEDIPVAELSDDATTRRPGGRGPRSRRVAALALSIAVLIGGTVVAKRAADDANGARRRVSSDAHRKVATVSDGQARVDVLSALRATTRSGSFAIHSTLSETSADGTTNAPIVADGTVNVDPMAMVATSNVSGAEITARVNGTDVWETGGGNFGMSADATSGPGAPLSQFAGLVTGSLGAREGAVAMHSMASPTGYLDLAEQSITAASWIGDAVFGGVSVHRYEVDVDAAKVLDRPGLSPEELKAGAAALEQLRLQGYRTTTVRLSIDANGFVRRTQTTVRFAEGGTVDADVTFSDFGCSTVVMLPNGPSIVPDPAGCAASP